MSKAHARLARALVFACLFPLSVVTLAAVAGAGSAQTFTHGSVPPQAAAGDIVRVTVMY